MTAQALYLRSAEYWERLEARKRERAGVDWYPYCSLANFEHFAALLGAEADFAALAGAGPLLDIGCADGDLAFFMESVAPGAAIHAVDHAGTNRNGMAGIAAMKRALSSTVEILDLNLDEGFELPARPYSLAFCLGLLYHVKNPFHLLESISRYARTCLLSTRIMRALPGGAPLPLFPVAYLLDPDELNGDATNFWIFNEAGLRRLLARAGWHVERWHSTGGAASDPDSLANDERAFCLLRSRRWLANIALGEGWHEESPEGWRWTARRFSFTTAATALALHFHVPEPAPAKTLIVHGVGEYCIDRPGSHVFRAAIPAGIARVDCELDRALPPSEGDPRELGIIVTEVA